MRLLRDEKERKVRLKSAVACVGGFLVTSLLIAWSAPYFLLAGEMAHVPDLVGNERNVRTLIAQTL
jgi:hypothetical protein